MDVANDRLEPSSIDEPAEEFYFKENARKEIPNTMNDAVSSSSLALRTEYKPQQQTYLSKLWILVRSLLRKTIGISDVSDMEKGALKLEIVDFSLEEVLNNLSEQIASAAQKKGLEFIIDRHPDVPSRLVGDPLRLGQVLLNLANNAIDSTDVGEVVIAVELVKKRGKDVKLEFSIRDTGIGFDEERVSGLFDKDSLSDGDESKGTGYRISAHLVEMMNGKVRIKSQPGDGNTLIFTIVLGHKEQTISTQLAPSPLLNGMHVLVVDDNMTTRAVMRVMLESLGFKVGEVSSGADAIEEILRADKSEQYELVLMDWMMPGMDGLEASRKIIMELDLKWHPVVIMVTDYGTEDARKEADRIGVEGFLEKPLCTFQLQNTIMELFGLK